MVATPTNVADSAVLPDLSNSKETRVRAVIRQHGPKTEGFINRRWPC
jgi:hypothetical protein